MSETMQQLDGAAMIAAERERQTVAEGFDARHDDEHVRGELALAAVCYTYPAPRPWTIKQLWPWDARWWKPGDLRANPENPHESMEGRIHDLVRAGALIAAEIDRLQRAGPR